MLQYICDLRLGEKTAQSVSFTEWYSYIVREINENAFFYKRLIRDLGWKEAADMLLRPVSKQMKVYFKTENKQELEFICITLIYFFMDYIEKNKKLEDGDKIPQHITKLGFSQDMDWTLGRGETNEHSGA